MPCQAFVPCPNLKSPHPLAVTELRWGSGRASLESWSWNIFRSRSGERTKSKLAPPLGVAMASSGEHWDHLGPSPAAKTTRFYRRWRGTDCVKCASPKMVVGWNWTPQNRCSILQQKDFFGSSRQWELWVWLQPECCQLPFRCTKSKHCHLDLQPHFSDLPRRYPTYG